MYQSIYNVLKRFKGDSTAETNGRHILPQIAKDLCATRPRCRLLDVGAGYGADLTAIASLLDAPECHAIESYPAAVAHLRNIGVAVTSVDIEHDPLPFEDDYFDLIICNQVIEHTKEIFWVVGEMARTLKVGGHILLGVPNLASLHNRVALFFGQQPPAVHVFGPHVRGFTPGGLRDFLERGGVLKQLRLLGGGFYPFPPSISHPLSRLFPRLAVSSFYVIEKTRGGKSFLDVLDSAEADVLVDTPYFRGGMKSRPASRQADTAGS